MLKQLFLSTLVLTTFTANARIKLTAELGNTLSNARPGLDADRLTLTSRETDYHMRLNLYGGISANVKVKVFTAGIGLKYWGISYGKQYILYDNVRASIGSPVQKNNLSNISMPVTAGVSLRSKKTGILIQAVAAPTYLVSHTLNMGVEDQPKYGIYNKDCTYNPKTEGFYMAVGGELGLEYVLTKHAGISVKYTYLQFLNNLDDKTPVLRTTYNQPFYTDNKPYSNIISVGINWFL